MNSSFQLYIKGRRLDRRDLLDPGFANIVVAVDENIRCVLKFCRRWLSGDSAFEVETSGSTGAPKRIVLTRAQMQSSAESTARALGLKSGDHALLCLSPRHIGGLMMVVRALRLGLRLFVVAPAANPLVEFTRNFSVSIDFASFVPMQMQAMLAAGSASLQVLNRMKAILVGGAPVSAELRKSIVGLHVPVLQTFGMTETVSHIALRRLAGGEVEEAYRALPGVELAKDNRGCLKIRATVTGDAWLATNDVVRLLPPDRFIWLGRADNVINSGGVKAHAEKIEEALIEALAEIPDAAVSGCFVAGLPDEKLGEKVVAVFAGSDFSAQTERALRDRLAGTLGKYELPRQFLFVREFCRTANGKLDKRATLDKICQAALFANSHGKNAEGQRKRS